MRSARSSSTGHCSSRSSGPSLPPDVVRIERRVATSWDGIDADADAHQRRSTQSRSLSRARWRTTLASSAARTSWTRSPRNSRWCEVRDCAAWCSEANRASARPHCWRRSRNRWCRSADATVVYGRCDETGVPLQPFRSVLADCVEHAPVDLLAEHVARCGGELVRICPQLATRVETAPEPTVSDDATERFLVFEAATDSPTSHRDAAASRA